MATTKAVTENGAVSIFDRLWDAAGPLPPEVARHVLAIRFPDADMDRMRQLAVRSGEGGITREELAEYDEYLRVSGLLAILHSKARMALGVKPERRVVRRG